MIPFPQGVETNDPHDLELGCCAYSTTTSGHAGYVGGCVIAVDPVAETVTTLDNFGPHQSPTPRIIPWSDIDMAAVNWSKRGAGNTAAQILAWAARQTTARDRQRNDYAHWLGIALQLQTIADNPNALFTPGAEARSRR